MGLLGSPSGGSMRKRGSSVSVVRRRNVIILFVISILIVGYRWFLHDQISKSGCMISFGSYKGIIYTHATETVGAPKCLVESKWMRIQQHAVKLTGSSSLIPDWLWIDYHDRINVLVQTGDDEFLVLKQTKYALEGRESKAVVGGIIEPGEHFQAAAHREVQEEMKLDCASMEFLGRYRTDVNRGMGWVHALLASNCVPFRQHQEEEGEDVVGEADLERQDMERITLAELRRAVQAGEFIEVQWSNTVSLAILHLDSKRGSG